MHEIGRVYHLVGKAFIALEDLQSAKLYLEQAYRCSEDNAEVEDDLHYVFGCIEEI